MNVATIFCAIGVAVSIALILYEIKHEDAPLWPLLCVFLFVGCGVLTWTTPEQEAKATAEDAARHIEEITPRKVSSNYGCTVYAFKPQDRWLYFTKCGDEVTTQNAYTVSSGSGKTKSTHTEVLEIKTK